MPYKDLKKQREYQRNWMADQRAEFFKGKCCVRCGSTEQLELDHIDRTQKTSHRIWSWRKERRDAELAKCQILCVECHRDKTAEDFGYRKSPERKPAGLTPRRPTQSHPRRNLLINSWSEYIAKKFQK